MAIRIPILTEFDPKGLRAANASFAKLQSSVGSLGRNFAAAGIAIGALGAVIAKNAQALARIETINAQTAQTIQSMGNASRISASEVETLAGSLESLTAVEAETIQEGANLLLTFGNIRNQMGAGNDIFTQTTKIMVDMGVALKKGPTATATMLGKALNDPIRGMTALTRVGVSFTDQQREQVKALQNSGDLMGAQKLILAELQNQYGGSGAAFAQTFTGQLQLMGHELGTIGEEATMAVMPALQGMVTELRALIPVIGPQLKAAIESVDWKGLGTAVVNFTRFLVENANAIAQGIGLIFAINTAFKAMQVAVGLATVALELKKWALAKVAAGMTATSIATGVLSTALKGLPWVALASLAAVAITNMVNVKQKTDLTTTSVNTFSESIRGAGTQADWAAGKFVDVKNAINNIPKNTDVVVNIKATGSSVLEDYGYNIRTGQPIQAPVVTTPTVTTPTTGGGGGGGSRAQTVSQVLRREGVLATRETKLLNAGVSAGFADLILSTATTKKTFQKELAKISTPKGLERAQARFNRTAAGQAEIAEAAAAAAQAAAQAAAELAAAQAETARKEAEAIAERERVYKSFADSVKNTFAGIKSSILGAFDLTQLGGSTNSITRNMEKLLTRLRAFATNVKSLATMGLNPALLQQIISAGPMAGARLAEGLVMGGQAGLSAINAGYSEFGALSGQIAQTGTESLFGTSQQQSVYNINVDGGVGSGSTIGKAIVDAIKAYERTSGAVWQGA